jgi:hypothetical protein
MRLGKGRLVFEIVKAYLNRYPNSTFEELSDKFPSNMQGSTGVINTLDNIKTKYENVQKKRHFLENEYILMSGDNIPFAVSTEWGIGNIHNLIKLAKDENFQIEEI